jgi:hypothetical protein
MYISKDEPYVRELCMYISIGMTPMCYGRSSRGKGWVGSAHNLLQHRHGQSRGAMLNTWHVAVNSVGLAELQGCLICSGSQVLLYFSCAS